MKAWIAILFTVSLVAACSVASVFLNFNLIWIPLVSDHAPQDCGGTAVLKDAAPVSESS
ncbi:MAG TPA: hypothetical protein VN881_04445 [Candidatus Acidoferrales bacterium]|jgi:hypothetical protein|nr:hypothetical protein [Candidatus Acidoferrales bacterium]